MNKRSHSVKQMTEIRYQILNATEKLLADEGLHALSVRKIAHSSRLATGTLYRYFKSKNETVRALNRRNKEVLAEYLFTHYDETKSIKARFLYLWNQMWAFGIDHPNAILCKPEFEKLPHDLQKKDELESEQLFAPIGKLFVQGVQQGIFADLPLPVLGSLTFEACANVLRRVIIDQIKLDDEQIQVLAYANFNTIKKQ